MSDNIPTSPEASAAPWKLFQMMTGYWVTQALYVAAKLGIADLLREGPVNCDVLAGKTVRMRSHSIAHCVLLPVSGSLRLY